MTTQALSGLRSGREGGGRELLLHNVVRLAGDVQDDPRRLPNQYVGRGQARA